MIVRNKGKGLTRRLRGPSSGSLVYLAKLTISSSLSVVPYFVLLSLKPALGGSFQWIIVRGGIAGFICLWFSSTYDQPLILLLSITRRSLQRTL